MEIRERKVGDVVVIELQGRVNISAHPERFQQLVRERLEAGERRFVANLAGCEWMDSTGLGELITSLVAVSRRGGTLKLAHVPHAVRGILAVSNLTQVFEIFESEQAAVESF